MLTTSTPMRIAIRPVVKSDHQRLLSLMHFEQYVHRHLDWISPLDMLDEQPFLVVEQDGQVHAALACPIDPPGIAWLRLFVSSEAVSYEAMWQLLWAEARSRLDRMGADRASAITVHPWFRQMLERSKFKHIQDVVFLIWNAPPRFPFEPSKEFFIRPMYLNDLRAVQEVDEAAFGPTWRNSIKTLNAAFEQSFIATVAEVEQQIVGYQISTAGPLGGHLARLAVHPNWHRRGIGTNLLIDLLWKFIEMKIYKVSVNTQEDNIASLRLYQKVGFRSTGEAYGVYEFRFGEDRSFS